RAAVEETNALDGLDLISVPAGVYPAPAGTFQNPGLTVTGDLVVTGAGAVPTIVSGGGTTRVFTVAQGATVTLRDLTVANGRRFDSVPEGASGIANRGTLTLLDVIVRDNQGGNSGTGGLGNAAGATLTLHRTVVAHNLLGDSFSASGLSNFGTAHIFDSTFRHNIGPAIRNGFNAGVLELVRSSLVRNRGNTYSQADSGIRNEIGAIATVVNSTISENVGSGIRSLGTITIRSSTIFGNRAYAPGGGGVGLFAGGTTTLRNTILAGNQGFCPGLNDCSGNGTIVSEGYNLIGEPSVGCTIQGDRTGELNGPALLAPLAANGGETPTNVPLDGSIAREAGNPAVPGSGGTACETTDQRGVARPQPLGGRCDIGAVEATPETGLTALAAIPPPQVDLTVNDTGTAEDVTPGDGACATATNTCTLAAAIQEANTKLGPVIVHLPAAVFTFTSGPYPDPFSEGPSALPHATGDLRLVGQGASVTKLRLEAANQNFRLLLAYGGRLTIEGVTLGDSNSVFALDMVRVEGSPLTLRDVVVEDTRCGEGAVAVSADTVLRRVTFARNAANGRSSEP